MSSSSVAPSLRTRPFLELLEDRCLLAAGSFMSEPIIPTIGPQTQAHLRSIFAQGLQLGNRPFVFSMAGDSNTAFNEFLNPLGEPQYNPTSQGLLGLNANLASTIEYFRLAPVDATGANSFTHNSLAAYGGWGTEDLLNPLTQPFASELVTVRPAFVLIMIGTKEVGFQTSLDIYRSRLTTLAGLALGRGVIPIFSTIPDAVADLATQVGAVNAVNQVVAEVAHALDVPLLNLWKALESLPYRGLSPDGLHLSAHPAGTGLFTAEGLLFGFNERNFSTIRMLDKMLRVVVGNGPADVEPTAEDIAYLGRLYQTVLGREADEPGLRFWSHVLASGVPRTSIAQEFWRSAEHRGSQVDSYFTRFFHREPDPASLAFWVNAFLAGAGEVEVELAMLSSPEYTSTTRTDRDFVGDLYLDLLGREPEAEELAEAEDRLAHGVSRTDLVQELLTSRPAYQLEVADIYADILDRQPDIVASAISVALLERSQASIESLAVSLLVSQEFTLPDR